MCCLGNIFVVVHNLKQPGGHHGRDPMVVGFTTTCAISVYHQQTCEFESR